MTITPIVVGIRNALQVSINIKKQMGHAGFWLVHGSGCVAAKPISNHHAQDLSKGLVAAATEATGVALMTSKVAPYMVGADTLRSIKVQLNHPTNNAWKWVLEHKLYAY